MTAVVMRPRRKSAAENAAPTTPGYVDAGVRRFVAARQPRMPPTASAPTPSAPITAAPGPLRVAFG
jgi:hypothetical protein